MDSPFDMKSPVAKDKYFIYFATFRLLGSMKTGKTHTIKVIFATSQLVKS